LNWLAHLLLSKKDIDFQLGNLLADPLKGRVWDGASQSIEDGMKMHKAIDRFTDSHPLFTISKSRLGEKGYLKAVVVDLVYDHFLARNWEAHASVTHSEFLSTFYSSAIQKCNQFPAQPRSIVTNLVKSDRLAKYQRFDGFVETLARIDCHLSPRIKAKDTTSSYIATIEREYSKLEQDFEQFFPQIMVFFKKHRLGSMSDHYLAPSAKSLSMRH
jgi:acyl carrier protein phosphodiesterase